MEAEEGIVGGVEVVRLHIEYETLSEIHSHLMLVHLCEDDFVCLVGAGYFQVPLNCRLHPDALGDVFA